MSISHNPTLNRTYTSVPVDFGSSSSSYSSSSSSSSSMTNTDGKEFHAMMNEIKKTSSSPHPILASIRNLIRGSIQRGEFVCQFPRGLVKLPVDDSGDNGRLVEHIKTALLPFVMVPASITDHTAEGDPYKTPGFSIDVSMSVPSSSSSSKSQVKQEKKDTKGYYQYLEFLGRGAEPQWEFEFRKELMTCNGPNMAKCQAKNAPARGIYVVHGNYFCGHCGPMDHWIRAALYLD